MSASTSTTETPGDAELISAVRGGDLEAYGTLFERHADSARRLARQLVSAGDVEDLVSEAFMKVLTVLQRGGGPDVAFRAYLLTSIRRLRVDRLRAASRVHTTDDIEVFDPGIPFRDTAVEGFENETAAKAFASLPERWQLVLWHTEVEGSRPAEIAPLLGMSPNSVSALAYRAREGLRQAFLTQHVAELEDDRCRWTHQHLGAYIRNGVSRRDATRVEDHLASCRSCMAIYLELTEVNSNLGAILAPLLLGGMATAYVGSLPGAAAPVGAATLALGRVRDFLAGHAAVSAVTGVAAVLTVVGGGTAIVMSQQPDPGLHDPVVAAPADDTFGTDSDRGPGAAPPPARRTRPARATATPDIGVVVTPTAAPTPLASPTSVPASQPVPAFQPAPTGEPLPTPTPTEDPFPTDDPTPTEDPTPTDDPPPTDEPTPTQVDVSVSATLSGDGPTFDVLVSVVGLPGDAGATLTITATDLVNGQLNLTNPGDPRCQLSDRVITCTLAPGADSTVALSVTAPHGATIAAAVTTALDDPDLANNATSVVLPPGR